MKLLTLLFPLMLSAGNPFNRIPDDILHVYSGLGIGCISGEVTFMHLTDKRWSIALPTAFISAVVIGVAKEEIYDRQWGKGTPSNYDKLNTSYGGLLSVPILCCRFDLYAKKHPYEYEPN